MGLRGASWNNNEDNGRAAIRNNNHPDNRNNNVGFSPVVARRGSPALPNGSTKLQTRVLDFKESGRAFEGVPIDPPAPAPKGQDEERSAPPVTRNPSFAGTSVIGGDFFEGEMRMSKNRTKALTIKPADLLTDVRQLILQARQGVARAVDSGMTTLYWHVGRRIRQDILKEKRAEYGEKIVSALGTQLSREFGRGFAVRNLFRMVRFAEVFPDIRIVSALRTQLGWTHFRQIIAISDPLKRDFYAEMCRIENWNTRTLEKKIGGMLFERTALSKKPDKLIRHELAALREQDKLTPDLVFRDPYFLDFLGLKDAYAEKDVEAAILREMEAFILELGVGFCFVERQKRMQIDDQDYHLDLLFYHRKLKRLVAIELKLGVFEAADKGQMELYLNWLKRYECDPDEAAPLGLILCAGKRGQHVELLELEKSGIHVASYWTKILPKKELEKKLHDAVRLARVRLQAGKD